MSKFFKEFRQFISRGNVVDMAVGVIVGSAFTAIVTALTKNVFQPLVNWALAGAGGGLESAVTMLKVVYDEAGAVDMTKSIYIDWGAVITAILNFFIIAMVLFSVVKTINKLRELGKSEYHGYTRKEYYALRRSGKKDEEIAALAAARDEEAKQAAKAAEEEAKKHTAEYLLEEIRDLLAERSGKQ